MATSNHSESQEEAMPVTPISIVKHGAHSCPSPYTGKHTRQISGISLDPGMSQYDYNGDGRIGREDLRKIMEELKTEKAQRKTYKTLAMVVGVLLVAVLGINAILTYVVIDISKDITVANNMMVAKSRGRHAADGSQLPLESAEAMRSHVVAENKVYTPPSGAQLLAMKSLVYVDSAGVHKHNVAGVTIGSKTATVYSTLPGIIFEFTPRGMFMLEVEQQNNSAGVQQSQEQPGRKLLRQSTMDCFSDDYEDETWDEDLEEYIVEQLRVTECTSWGGMFTVMTYSVLNESGEWEIDSQQRWFQDEVAPWFFTDHDTVGVAVKS